MSFWSRFFGMKRAVARGDVIARTHVDDQVNRQDGDGRTELMNAFVGRSDFGAFRALGGWEAGVNLRDRDGMTALMHAVCFSFRGRGDDLIAIHQLLKGGADVNLQDHNGRTVLMYAASRDYALVELLVRSGAEVNLRDGDGRTALMYAASMGNTEVVAGLAEIGGDLNTQENDGRTALIRAAESGHVDVVAALLEAGADVNVEDKRGCTALSRATESGRSEAIALLKGCGSSAKVTDPGSETESEQARMESFNKRAIEFFELARESGIEAARKRFPDRFSDPDHLKFVLRNGVYGALFESRQSLVECYRDQRRYREAAPIWRAMALEHGRDVAGSYFEECGLENEDYEKREFLISVLLGFAGREHRREVMRRFFGMVGYGWWRDNPERADNTYCDSCDRQMKDEPVYINGSYLRCGDCINQSVDKWEGDGLRLDYFGEGVVRQAAAYSSKYLNDVYRNSSSSS